MSNYRFFFKGLLSSQRVTKYDQSFKGTKTFEDGLTVGYTESNITGTIRWNPETNSFEGFHDDGWKKFDSHSVDTEGEWISDDEQYRIIIDGENVTYEKLVDESWEVISTIGKLSNDLDSIFIQAQGIIGTNADVGSIEQGVYLPEDVQYFDFENNLDNQNGDNQWTITGDVEFLNGGKFGSSSLKIINKFYELSNAEIQSRITTSNLGANENRYTSQIYNEKLYLPQNFGTNLRIVDLSDNSVSTIDIGGASEQRRTSQIYDGKLYLPQDNGTNLRIVDLSDNSISTVSLGASEWRNTSQIYNGKLYLPPSIGTTLRIVDLSDNSVSTVSLGASESIFTSQVYDGKLYLPPSGGTNLRIVDLSDNSISTVPLGASEGRETSQIYNGKLYLPQSGGTNLRIVDLSDNSISTIPLGADESRFTSQIYDGKLYLPQHSGTNLRIVDLSDNSISTVSLGDSEQRRTSQIYDGKLYLPQNSGTNLRIVPLEELRKGKLEIPVDEVINPTPTVRTIPSSVTTDDLRCYAVHNGKIYIPADNSNRLHIIDVYKKTLVTPAVFTRSRKRSTVSVANNKLYIPGYNANGNLVEVVNLTDLSTYDVDVGGTLYTGGSVAHEGKVYIPATSSPGRFVIIDSEDDSFSSTTYANFGTVATDPVVYNNELFFVTIGSNILRKINLDTMVLTNITTPATLDNRGILEYEGKIYIPNPTVLYIYDVALNSFSSVPLVQNLVKDAIGVYCNKIYFSPRLPNNQHPVEYVDLDTLQAYVIPSGLVSQASGGRGMWKGALVEDEIFLFPDIDPPTTFSVAPVFNSIFVQQGNNFNLNFYLKTVSDIPLSVFDQLLTQLKISNFFELAYSLDDTETFPVLKVYVRDVLVNTLEFDFSDWTFLSIESKDDTLYFQINNDIYSYNFPPIDTDADFEFNFIEDVTEGIDELFISPTTPLGNKIDYYYNSQEPWSFNDNPVDFTKDIVVLPNPNGLIHLGSHTIFSGHSEKVTPLMLTANSVIDLNYGGVFNCTFESNVTDLSIIMPNRSAHFISFTLILNQGVTPRTISWPDFIKWELGEIPDLSTAESTSILNFTNINRGDVWFASIVGRNFV